MFLDPEKVNKRRETPLNPQKENEGEEEIVCLAKNDEDVVVELSGNQIGEQFEEIDLEK